MSTLLFAVTVKPIRDGFYIAECKTPGVRVTLTGRTHLEALMKVVQEIMQPWAR